MTTAARPLSIYQLRIVLRGMSPLIWRRVLVPSHTTLAHLHTILQILFTWSDEHLHSFYVHGREYGSSGAPTHGVLLRDLCLHRGERFRYVYDFGAYWECEIRLEVLLPLVGPAGAFAQEVTVSPLNVSQSGGSWPLLVISVRAMVSIVTAPHAPRLSAYRHRLLRSAVETL